MNRPDRLRDRASTLTDDLRTLWAFARPKPAGEDLAARMDAFYAPQAEHYDRFRERLLHGRRELIEALPVDAGATWVDLGGGTGRTLDFLGPGLRQLGHVHVVDLSASLLRVAADRVRINHWSNVHLHHAAAADAPLPAAAADVIVFSYSLTMMPAWFEAIDAAHRLLKPNGLVAVVDFYVSRKYSAPLQQHGPLTRGLMPAWFARSNVFPSADHLPYLLHRFASVIVDECTGSLPYLPGVRVPFYRFVGRRSSD